ncbi:methyltransferase domain-containing protein [Clostridiaceae bacterium M8S5]|nr:methyltransferase domain-containing protein [Clostridiaceae bacterium M8S5]
MDLYKSSALYNQNMSQNQQSKLLDFYRKVFEDYDITTLHDCSIGAGGTTLPLAKLGYKISGSDLSENLLKKAKENLKEIEYDVELFISDFRSLKTNLQNTYDCIISTGNSLPHVNNEDVRDFIKNISNKINDRGLIYIDIRNWDKILKERPIFTPRDPFVMTKEEHTSLYQIWDWHDNGSVDFIFATSTDKMGKHEKVSFVFAPTYYPLKLKDYEKILNDFGFEIRKCFDMDYIWNYNQGKTKHGEFEKDFDEISWYSILAQKIK